LAKNKSRKTTLSIKDAGDEDLVRNQRSAGSSWKARERALEAGRMHAVEKGGC
jgi:hypothetical protein